MLGALETTGKAEPPRGARGLPKMSRQPSESHVSMGSAGLAGG